MFDTYASSLHVKYTSTAASAATKLQVLPRLPVPKLNDTLKIYLATVRPHLNDEEFAVTSSLVQDFGADGGIGQKLQVRSLYHVSLLLSSAFSFLLYSQVFIIIRNS